MTESLYLTGGPRWKIGDPGNPSEDDREVHGEFQAIEAARQLAKADYQRPIAVWDMARNRIAHLFICGEEFKPV